LGEAQRRVRPSIPFEGRALYFDFDALAAGSAACGLDLLSFHPARCAETLSGSGLRALLAISGRMTESEAGEAINAAGIHKAFEAVCRAWINSMPPRKKADRHGKRISSEEKWAQCWSAARVRLGLTDDEFGSLTPRQLRQLLDEYGERLEEQKILFGLVAAMVANCSAHPPEKPIQPMDFFLGAKKERAVRQSPQSIAATRSFLMSQVTEKRKSDETQKNGQPYPAGR
jgi:hypothetical protein